MRFARAIAMGGLLVGCGQPLSSPLPSVSASARVPRDPEREAAIALGKSGKLERALAAIDAVNAKRPETRPQTLALEMTWLGELGRCKAVRALALVIRDRGDVESNHATSAASEECDRLEQPREQASTVAMRSTFHQAASLEAKDPVRATKLYTQSWTTAPSLPALLGLARTAKASGDVAQAERYWERALAFAERGGDVARLAVTAQVKDDFAPTILRVDDQFAWTSFDKLIAKQDLTTGALSVIATFPKSTFVHAASSSHAIVEQMDTHELRIVELGVDDFETANPIDARAPIAVHFAPAGNLVAVVSESHALILDAHTSEVVANPSLPANADSGGGFTADEKKLVVRLKDRLCFFSAPAWNACEDPPELRTTHDGATVGGHFVAFLPDDSTIRVYDLDAKRTVGSITGHFGSVLALTVTPDGKALVSASTSRAVAWNVATKARKDIFSSGEDYFHPVVTPDGKRFVSVAPNAVVVRDASAFLTRLPIVSAGSLPLVSLPRVFVYGPGGVMWIGGNRIVHRIDLRAETIRSYGVPGAVVDLAVSPDEKFFGVGDSYGNMGSNVYVHDATDGAIRATAPGGMLGKMWFDAGKLMTFSSSGMITLDPAKGTSFSKLVADPKDIQAMDIATASEDGTIVTTDASISLTDVGVDAYVVTNNGKSHVVGNQANVRCNVGALSLPLDVCRDRLL